MKHNMKLIKIENEKEVWYFTSITRAAEYIGCTYNHVKQVIHGVCKKAKGWSIEEIEDDYIMSKFIDPEKHYSREEYILTKEMHELLKQIIMNDKRIENLENKIEWLKKNIEKVDVQD